MTEKYKVPDILEAINTLLKNDNDKEKPLMLEGNEEKPLKLINQVHQIK